MNRMHWIAVGGLAVGLVLLLGAGWQLALRPLGQAYEAKVAEKAEVEAKLADTKAKANQYEKFQAEAENVRRDLDFYLRRLEPNFNASELYNLVDGLGHSLNLADWKFETKPRERTKLPGLDLDETYVKVSFRSDLDHLGRFLNACVTQLRLVVPTGVTLRRYIDPAGVYSDTVESQVELRIFASPVAGGAK